MATRARRATRAHPRHGIDEALSDAADAIADMAQRVQLNGPEPTYASEKLAHALYKSACSPIARAGASTRSWSSVATASSPSSRSTGASPTAA